MRLAMLAGVVAALTVPSVASAQEEGWRWFAACPSPTTMSLVVRLDTTVLFTASFPICRLAARPSAPARELTFTMTPRRAIAWIGYRSDSGETTSAGRPLEVRIWQAGADSVGPILGVVVLGTDSIFMSTLHIALADTTAMTELASGLIITTAPRRGRPPS